MIICGIGLGILVVSSPKSVLVGLKIDIIKAFKGGIASKEKFIDLLVLLYELFMLGRRKGTPALDEHVSDPQNSSIFTKYPSFLNDAGLVEFLCNSLRPIVDGRCKPAEIGGILKAELNSREAEAGRSIKAIEMIADALPGVGIVAAVLGIINTMSNLEDPSSVGAKVAAALSGTFLGIFLAYGIGIPLGRLVSLNQTQEFLYYHIVERSVSGFATGLSPIMAVEIGRRSLDNLIQPSADELEEKCKDAAKGG
jgi:chemotaxis protein MotA